MVTHFMVIFFTSGFLFLFLYFCFCDVEINVNNKNYLLVDCLKTQFLNLMLRKTYHAKCRAGADPNPT